MNKKIMVCLTSIFLIFSMLSPVNQATAASKYIKTEDFVIKVAKELKFNKPYIKTAIQAGKIKP